MAAGQQASGRHHWVTAQLLLGEKPAWLRERNKVCVAGEKELALEWPSKGICRNTYTLTHSAIETFTSICWDIHFSATGDMDVKMDNTQKCHLSGNTHSEKCSHMWTQSPTLKYASSYKEPSIAGTRMKRVNQGLDFGGFTGWLEHSLNPACRTTAVLWIHALDTMRG